MGEIYNGVAGVRRRVKEAYVGVSGVRRKVKEVYAGVSGVRRLVWSGEIWLIINYFGEEVVAYSQVMYYPNPSFEYDEIYAQTKVSLGDGILTSISFVPETGWFDTGDGFLYQMIGPESFYYIADCWFFVN